MGSMSGGAAGGKRVGPQGRATPLQAGAASPTMDSRARNPRYEQGTIATRPATVGNITTALAGALPGGGLIQGAIGLAKGTPGDPYSGPVGKTTGYSYNGADRIRVGSGRVGKKTALGA